MSPGQPKKRLLAIIGPGILVAATGVGAGDLATASFTGMNLGVAVLWAVLLGSFLKFVLTEGLARWQLATGETLLEGCVRNLGKPFQIVFLLYLIAWTLFVCGAIMAACGVTAQAIFPVFEDASDGKLWFGILHTLAGSAMVLIGGFKLFQRVMAVCIGVMFVTVIATAVLIGPDWGQVFRGMVFPTIPKFDTEGIPWTVALFGGVGGTLTVLCYGYWIRESGRKGEEDLRVCRIDLAVGYAMTAMFGLGMVIIGSEVQVQGKGAGLIAALAGRLEEPLGPVGKWAFLVGAWGAVFSSLLGVWQSVPYIFSDFVSLWLKEPDEAQAKRVSTKSRTYRGYLAFMALAPIFMLLFDFQTIQKYYGILGACFIPFLAFALLLLNNRAKLVGERSRNRWTTNAVLGLTLALFVLALYFVVTKTFA